MSSVIVPVDIELLSTSVAANTEPTWSGSTTYSLGQKVKVISQTPHKVYESLRDDNTNRFPPDYLEPVVEVSKSTTSTEVATGEKTLTVETNKSFTAGMEVLISKVTTPKTVHMNAEIISYTSGTGALVVSVYSVTGSGTHNSWKIETNDEIGFWKEVESTNQYKMLDEYINTKTEDEGSIVVRIPSEGIDRLSFFNLICSNIDVKLLHTTLFELYKKSEITHTHGDFGRSCAISGNGLVLAVGLPQARPYGIGTGNVKIYDLINGFWVFRHNVTTPDYEVGSEFGYSCALNNDGSILFVGAWKRTVDMVAEAGQVHVFDYNGTSWSEREDAIVIDSIYSIPPAIVQFGSSCSCNSNGTVVAVGCGNRNVVYVLEWTTEWTLRETIRSPEENPQDKFGASVAISLDGNTLAVGATRELIATTVEGFGVGYFGRGSFGMEQSVPGLAPGRVYVFTYLIDEWVLREYVESPDISEMSDYFGQAVAFDTDGNRLVVTSKGTAYLFHYNAGWTVLDSVDVAEDTSCALDGTGRRMLVGQVSLLLVSDYYYQEKILWSNKLDIVYGSASIVNIRDWYEYFFGEMNIRSDATMKIDYGIYNGIFEIAINGATHEAPVSLGNLVAGRSNEIGSTVFDATATIEDYSQKETDPETGITSLKQGKWAKINEVDVYIKNDKVDSVYKMLANLRGVPTAWIADNDNYEMFMVYGFFSRFSVVVKGNCYSFCSLEINGLI